MARQEKKVGGDPTLTLMIVAGCLVVGVILVIYFVKLKADNPILEGKATSDDYLVAKTSGDVGSIEVSDEIHTSDPKIKAYQTWQHAKKIARDDLERGIAMCEGTIEYMPQYAGDAYFTCVQCIEHFLETRLFLKRHLPKEQMPMTKGEAKAYFDREMVYYDKAKQAYATEGAKTMLGLSRKPEEMANRIDEKIRDKVEGIIPWWMERLPD